MRRLIVLAIDVEDGTDRCGHACPFLRHVVGDTWRCKALSQYLRVSRGGLVPLRNYACLAAERSE